MNLNKSQEDNGEWWEYKNGEILEGEVWDI